MPEYRDQANSIAEVYYHVMVSSCNKCGKGPLEAGDATSLHYDRGSESKSDQPDAVRLTITCQACAAIEDRTYGLPRGTGLPKDGSPARVNDSDEPSALIDLAEWVTLFRLLTASAAQTTSKPEARRLGLEAAQCLEEALKFFDDPESDLPSPSAFFTDRTKELSREHPGLYSRERLLELRSKLPSETVMRNRIQGKTKKRRWWKPW
ncbi:MAG: hypothetical protein ACPGXK_10910 [Phycisphaerae bacterium]